MEWNNTEVPLDQSLLRFIAACFSMAGHRASEEGYTDSHRQIVGQATADADALLAVLGMPDPSDHALQDAAQDVVDEFDNTYDASCEDGETWQGGCDIPVHLMEKLRNALLRRNRHTNHNTEEQS